MSKYIIKNCPAIVTSGFNTHLPYCIDDDLNRDCQDCTDCLLKQIVELCKNQKAKTTYESGMRDKAIQILKLLDIQEVE